MERLLITNLLDWKKDSKKSPLILTGARQVGKTWLGQHFGNEYYRNMVYVNFEKNKSIHKIFDGDKEVSKIVNDLEIFFNQKIDPNKTLIFFDEIQECRNALASMRYFNINDIKYDVVLAGSLLGINNKVKGFFPVGDLYYVNVFPLNFIEFLMSKNEYKLVDFLNSLNVIEPINEAFLNKLNEYFFEYLSIGGLPRVIEVWNQTSNTIAVDTTIDGIMNAYKTDVSNYAANSNRVNSILSSFSTYFSKENKKFFYNYIKEGARSREYEDSLEWLVNADLIYKINRMTTIALPLNGYDDSSSFKLYPLDVGILRNLCGLDFNFLKSPIALQQFVRGRYFESYVLTSLANQYGRNVLPRYWSINQPNYEVDFIIDHKNELIPVEVKSSQSIRSPSLKYFINKYEDVINTRIKFSFGNLRLDGKQLNIPLCLADYTKKFLDIIYNTK